MPNQPSSEMMVEAHGITVRFGDFVAVKDVSFSVGRGEIFGFLGANGAGKTTTIRVLCGLLIPSSGTAKVAGLDVTEKTSAQVKSKVGYMSQKFTLYSDLTVAENLEFASELRSIEPDIYQKKQKELLEFISMDRPVTTLVKDLPSGVKQQIALVAALIHNPEVIFLDEPTAGVSPAARARFWELIQSLAKQGKTIFVTSHYMDEVEQCGRIALMRSGEIIALDSPAALKKSTFPEPLFELVPTGELPRKQVEDWKAKGVFASISPYGLRYHVSIANQSAWETFKKENEKILEVHPIVPSLEDVFVRLVEGKSR